MIFLFFFQRINMTKAYYGRVFKQEYSNNGYIRHQEASKMCGEELDNHWNKNTDDDWLKPNYMNVTGYSENDDKPLRLFDIAASSLLKSRLEMPKIFSAPSIHKSRIGDVYAWNQAQEGYFYPHRLIHKISASKPLIGSLHLYGTQFTFQYLPLINAKIWELEVEKFRIKLLNTNANVLNENMPHFIRSFENYFWSRMLSAEEHFAFMSQDEWEDMEREKHCLIEDYSFNMGRVNDTFFWNYHYENRYNTKYAYLRPQRLIRHFGRVEMKLSPQSIIYNHREVSTQPDLPHICIDCGLEHVEDDEKEKFIQKTETEIVFTRLPEIDAVHNEDKLDNLLSLFTNSPYTVKKGQRF